MNSINKATDWSWTERKETEEKRKVHIKKCKTRKKRALLFVPCFLPIPPQSTLNAAAAPAQPASLMLCGNCFIISSASESERTRVLCWCCCVFIFSSASRRFYGQKFNVVCVLKEKNICEESEIKVTKETWNKTKPVSINEWETVGKKKQEERERLEEFIT